jgi:hypothetical protein
VAKKDILNKNVKEKLMKDFTFENLMNKYFDNDLTIFKTNVLSGIGSPLKIYDTLLINLFMLYFIHSCYTKENFELISEKMLKSEELNLDEITKFLDLIKSNVNCEDYLNNMTTSLLGFFW